MKIPRFEDIEAWTVPRFYLATERYPLYFKNRKISGFKGFYKSPRLKEETDKNISKRQKRFFLWGKNLKESP
jgi:hypothetical protein